MQTTVPSGKSPCSRYLLHPGRQGAKQTGSPWLQRACVLMGGASHSQLSGGACGCLLLHSSSLSSQLSGEASSLPRVPSWQQVAFQCASVVVGTIPQGSHLYSSFLKTLCGGLTSPKGAAGMAVVTATSVFVLLDPCSHNKALSKGKNYDFCHDLWSCPPA